MMAEYIKNDVGKLRRHLHMLLEEETSRTAENIDVQKVSRILEMAEMCGNCTDISDIEDFAQRFNRRYHTLVRPLRPQKRLFVLKLARLAACLVLFAFLFAATEFVAVNAFGFSIVQTICNWGDSIQKYADKVDGGDKAIEKSLKPAVDGRIVLPQTEIDMAADFYLISGYGEKEAKELALEYVKEVNALYQEAIANNYTVTDQEIEDFLEEQKQQYEQAENKEEVYVFMDRFENEQAYWEFQAEIYKKDLPIQKYNAASEREFIEGQMANSGMDGSVIQEKWEDEFSKRKAEAVEKYEFVVE